MLLELHPPRACAKPSPLCCCQHHGLRQSCVQVRSLPPAAQCHMPHPSALSCLHNVCVPDMSSVSSLLAAMMSDYLHARSGHAKRVLQGISREVQIDCTG